MWLFPSETGLTRLLMTLRSLKTSMPHADITSMVLFFCFSPLFTNNSAMVLCFAIEGNDAHTGGGKVGTTTELGRLIEFLCCGERFDAVTERTVLIGGRLFRRLSA